jgi:hypothetical protein
MPTVITGNDGINQVQAGSIQSDDLAAGVGGKVLQVVNGSVSSESVTTSSTFQDTGLSASITPASSSSKILILVDQVGCRVNDSTERLGLRLLADSVEIIKFESNGGFMSAAGSQNFGSCSTSFLHSPGTNLSITYKTQFKSADGGSVAVQDQGSQPTPSSTITLMEIAG